MTKQVTILIALVLGVVLSITGATLDYVSWVIFLLFSILIDIWIYTKKVEVSNEDRVKFHSRNLLGNIIWNPSYQERKYITAEHFILSLFSALSIALQIKAFYLSTKDPLTYTALQVFVYWTKSPSSTWWIPCAITYFFFAAEALLLAKMANPWLLADCAAQLVFFGVGIQEPKPTTTIALFAVTPIACLSTPTYMTIPVFLFLCLRKWNQKKGVDYIQQHFHVPLMSISLALVHWDLRTFSCALVAIVAFFQRRILGHKWTMWENIVFWQMTVMQMALIDWMHIYVSLFY